MEAPIPDSAARAATKAPSQAGLSRWARENPDAFAGLWFATAAGLVTGQALHILPGLVAEARALGGLVAWQWGAFALGYVYVAPVLLALLMGTLLGGPIVAGGYPDGRDTAVRGTLIGASSLAAWLVMAPLLVRPLIAASPMTAGNAFRAEWGAAGLLLLCIPFLLVVGIGGAAGFLLHALFTGAPRLSSDTGRESTA
jgi:hypothetical protein